VSEHPLTGKRTKTGCSKTHRILRSETKRQWFNWAIAFFIYFAPTTNRQIMASPNVVVLCVTDVEIGHSITDSYSSLKILTAFLRFLGGCTWCKRGRRVPVGGPMREILRKGNVENNVEQKKMVNDNYSSLHVKNNWHSTGKLKKHQKAEKGK
jgi:hypothetical protein